jgi:hypothetical protein
MNFQPDKKEEALSAPSGWVTPRSLLSRIDIQHQTLLAKLNRYRSEHPDWFKTYLDRNNIPLEHIHPDLVKIILEPYEGDDGGGYRNS